MNDHRLLSDDDLAATPPVTADELMGAVAIVCAMTEDDFCDVAEVIGLDIWSGMSNGSKASRRRRFKSL